MSTCGCGCCPKCGCQATCSCNNSLQDLESRGDFSFLKNDCEKTVAEKYAEQDNFNGDLAGASQADHRCSSDRADGSAYTKKGRCGVSIFKADYGFSE